MVLSGQFLCLGLGECSGKLKVSIVLGQEVVAHREEMRRSRGVHLPWGVLFPGIGYQKRS